MMATIEKRVLKSGEPRFTATVYVGPDPTGQRRSPLLSKTFAREKDARAWGAEQEVVKAGGQRPVTTKQTLRAYLEHWLKVKAGEVSERTIDDYQSIVRRWVLRPPEGTPRLGSVRLDQLSVDAFEVLYASMRERGLAPRTIRYCHVVLRMALKDAVRAGKLPRNPTDYAKVPKRPKDDAEHEGPRVRAMSKEQADRFLAAARGDRLSALWHVLLMGGLRPSEAFGLQWPDVDFKDGSVRVVRTLTRVGGGPWKLTKPKTKTSRRTIPLPQVAMDELRKWKRTQAAERLAVGPEWTDHGFVFTTQTGSPLQNGNVWTGPFRRVMREAGLGETGATPAKPRSGPTALPPFKPAFRIYDLRHTCATLLLMAGESVKVVSERLGHASIVLTADTYSHVLPTMQKGAADKLEAMFGT
jgi:integrase